MRISAIGAQNYSNMAYGKNNKSVKKSSQPSFGTIYEYKPIQPEGKVISAAAIAALITGLSVSHCNNKEAGMNNNPDNIEVFDSISEDNSYYYKHHKENEEDSGTSRTYVLTPKENSWGISEDEDSIDVLLNDSITVPSDSDSIRYHKAMLKKHEVPENIDSLHIHANHAGKNNLKSDKIH